MWTCPVLRRRRCPALPAGTSRRYAAAVDGMPRTPTSPCPMPSGRPSSRRRQRRPRPTGNDCRHPAHRPLVQQLPCPRRRAPSPAGAYRCESASRGRGRRRRLLVEQSALTMSSPAPRTARGAAGAHRLPLDIVALGAVGRDIDHAARPCDPRPRSPASPPDAPPAHLRYLEPTCRQHRRHRPPLAAGHGAGRRIQHVAAVGVKHRERPRRRASPVLPTRADARGSAARCPALVGVVTIPTSTGSAWQRVLRRARYDADQRPRRRQRRSTDHDHRHPLRRDDDDRGWRVRS